MASTALKPLTYVLLATCFYLPLVQANQSKTIIICHNIGENRTELKIRVGKWGKSRFWGRPELERVGAFPPCSPPRVELLSPHSVDARTQCQRARTLVCNFRIQGKFANTSLEGDTFASLVVEDVPNKFLQSQRTKMSSSGSSHRVPHSYSVPKGNGGKVVMEFVDKVYDQAPGFQVWDVLTFALLTLCVA